MIAQIALPWRGTEYSDLKSVVTVLNRWSSHTSQSHYWNSEGVLVVPRLCLLQDVCSPRAASQLSRPIHVVPMHHRPNAECFSTARSCSHLSQLSSHLFQQLTNVMRVCGQYVQELLLAHSCRKCFWVRFSSLCAYLCTGAAHTS